MSSLSQNMYPSNQNLNMSSNMDIRNPSERDLIAQLKSQIFDLEQNEKNYDALQTKYKTLSNDASILNEEKMRLEYENKINEINNEYNIYIEKLKNENKNNIIKKEYDDGRYEGEMKNGKMEGKGIYYLNNGDRYEGEFKNELREGKGIYYYNDGDRYEGEFKNDKREGKGIFYYNNGHRYEGDWRNDKMEGKGIYYYKNGNREMGDYLNGKEIGKHVTLTFNGEVKTEIYN